MIPKIICWLFGHIYRRWDYVGNGIEEAHWNQKCPRCGAKL